MVADALTLALFFLGVALLWKGADWLVEGAIALARRYGVSPLVTGLTVVSFGTSAPEFAVNVLAALRGSGELAMGNILGSNVANILLILGAAAVVAPVVVPRSTVKAELPFSILAVVLIAVLAIGIPGFSPGATLTRVDGLVLLTGFALFMWYVAALARAGTEPLPTMDVDLKGPLPFAFVLGGGAALAAGANWMVDGALVIAELMDLSEEAVGFTVVALGTSLPELAASVAAAWKRHSDIVVGNVVGSNIFNILWVLGITAIIHPLPVPSEALIDIGVVVAASLLVVVLVQRSAVLHRWHGGPLLVAYVGYVAYVLTRG